MDIGRDQLKDIVFSAITTFNSTQDPKIVLEEDTPLMGRQATLDSMGLVTLIIEIEQQLQETLNLSIDFTHEKAMALRVSPFRRIRTMIDFIYAESTDQTS